MPERVTVSSRREKSAEAVVVGGKAAKPSRRQHRLRFRSLNHVSGSAITGEPTCMRGLDL